MSDHFPPTFRDESWWVGQGWASEARLFIPEGVEEDLFKRAVDLETDFRGVAAGGCKSSLFLWSGLLFILVTLRPEHLNGNRYSGGCREA